MKTDFTEHLWEVYFFHLKHCLTMEEKFRQQYKDGKITLNSMSAKVNYWFGKSEGVKFALNTLGYTNTEIFAELDKVK